MVTQFQQFEQLTDALESGNYSRMAKAAKAVGIFEGQAPKKADLTSKIEDFLNANVSIDAAPVLPEPVASMLLNAVDIVERDSVPFPVPDNASINTPAAGVDNTPQPTGKGGGNGEFYWWPEQKVYSTMYNGQPRKEDQFSAEEWAVFGKRLPDFTDLKPAVVKAAKKAAEPTVYKYTVTVSLAVPLTFDSTDPDLAASELTLETLNQLLANQGQRTVRPTFGLAKGKVKKSGSRSTSGESELYSASCKDDLKQLSLAQKQMLKEMAKPDGLPLSDWQKWGATSATNFGHRTIGFHKKGYHQAIKKQNGAMVFDPGSMYPGYELSHSLG